MKNTHIRIVCLKNQSHSPESHHSGLIIPQREQPGIPQKFVPPSLAFLSSRIQENQQNDTVLIPQTRQNCKKGSSSLGSLQISNAKPRQIEDTLPTIQKYFEGQKMMSDNKKSTIRHMMGSIDFSGDKKRQKKISKTLKKTIQGLSMTQPVIDMRTNNKAVISPKKYPNSQNRTFLEQDFQIFIHNKKQQLTKSKEPRLEEEEGLKMKRLSVVNPERQLGVEEEKKVNLFHFQNQIKRQLIPSVHQTSKYSSIARCRLEQKIFRMQLNLNEGDSFDWSRFKSRKGFSFSTVEP